MSQECGHEVPRSTLERFASKEASETERAQVLDHLATGCAHCQRTLRVVGWHGERGEMRRTHGNVAPLGAPAGAYDEVFAAAHRITMSALDRQHAPVKDLLAEVEAMPVEEREFKVRNARRYAAGELALALVDRSYELRYSDHTAMLHYARLAVAAADAAMPETAGGRSSLHDCRARAWAQLGNAQRTRGELAEAERSFDAAVRYLESGSGDVEAGAWVGYLHASLHIAQRAFTDAIPLLEEARAHYRRQNDRTREAGVLTTLAWARIASGNPEPAIAPLQRAIGILEPFHPWEEKLVRVAMINLVLCYIDIDKPRDAAKTVALGELYFEHCPDPIAWLHWKWQEGKVDRERGELYCAEVRLVRVRDGLLEADLKEQVGEVSLDLAMVYARSGNRAEFLRCVGEAGAIFQSLGAKRELLAAFGQLAAMAHTREAAVLARQLLLQCRGGVPRAEVS